MAYFIFHVNVPHQKRVAVVNIKLFSNIFKQFFRYFNTHQIISNYHVILPVLI